MLHDSLTLKICLSPIEFVSLRRASICLTMKIAASSEIHFVFHRAFESFTQDLVHRQSIRIAALRKSVSISLIILNYSVHFLYDCRSCVAQRIVELRFCDPTRKLVFSIGENV